MLLLGDEAQLEACFGPFGDSANLDVRLVHGLRRTYHRLRNSLTHPMELLDDMGHVKSHFGPFEDVVSVDARYVHGLRQTYHRLRNCFGRT
jgi:uncharacterized Fe-S cluster-containing radical SAM superfamily protein